MKFISNNNINDPSINLAMEEYVLKIYLLKKVIFYFILTDLQLLLERIRIQLKKLTNRILINIKLM